MLFPPFCSRPSVASESSSSSSPFLIKASSTGTSSLASCPSSSSIANQRLQGKKYLNTVFIIYFVQYTVSVVLDNILAECLLEISNIPMKNLPFLFRFNLSLHRQAVKTSISTIFHHTVELYRHLQVQSALQDDLVGTDLGSKTDSKRFKYFPIYEINFTFILLWDSFIKSANRFVWKCRCTSEIKSWQISALSIIITYVVSSFSSTISTRSKNQPALAWLLSWRILSFFSIPRSTAVMLKMSS